MSQPDNVYQHMEIPQAIYYVSIWGLLLVAFDKYKKKFHDLFNGQ